MREQYSPEFSPSSDQDQAAIMRELVVSLSKLITELEKKEDFLPPPNESVVRSLNQVSHCYSIQKFRLYQGNQSFGGSCVDPKASPIRKASFHLAIRSEREKEPTFN